MSEAYRKLKTKPKTIAELKEAFQVIWGNLPQGPIERLWKTSQSKKRFVLELVEDTLNIHSDNRIFVSDH